MTKVVKFPPAKVAKAIPVNTKPQPAREGEGDPAFVKFLWVVVVLLWPAPKWVVSIDCVVQLLRTIYYWNTAGLHAGWTFLAHSAVLTALTYFVSQKRRGL